MKLLISGGRSNYFNKAAIEFLTALFFKHNFSLLLNGMAKGIDASARSWAQTKDLPIKEFYPAWEKHGKKAGILRNLEMLDELTKNDMVIVFPGGPGSDHVRKEAAKRGFNLIDLYDTGDKFIE